MQILRVEPTPNPNAIKFVLTLSLAPGASREFQDAEAAKGDEVAEALFGIEGVSALFFNENYITVTMSSDADWHKVYREAQQRIEAQEPPEEAVEVGTTESLLAPGVLVEGNELMERILAVLRQRVVPALSADGGGLQVLGIEDKTLSIRYQGACGSCPSSIAGTLQAIQNLLRTEVDPELMVVPA